MRGKGKKNNLLDFFDLEASAPISPEASFVANPGSVDSSLEASEVIPQNHGKTLGQRPFIPAFPFSHFSIAALGNHLSALLEEQGSPLSEDERQRAEFNAFMDPTGGGMIL